MASFDQRLKVLESKNAINKDDVTEIFIVAFADKDDLNLPINHIRYEDENFYIAEGETEEDFKSRAIAEIRKNRQAEPNSILLLFGYSDSNR